MAHITVRTASVSGGGGVTCRRCDRSTKFTTSEWIEFIDLGHRFLALGVKDGISVLHDCKRPSKAWWCSHCRSEVTPIFLRPYTKATRPPGSARCPDCLGEVTQR